MPSEGPNSPAAATGNSGGPGANNWSDPTNCFASDDSRATVVLAPSDSSRFLKATSFGFAVPGGATIDGIAVEIERSCSLVSDTISDAAVQIVKGGVAGGDDKSAAGNWPSLEAYRSYGGVADLWGLTWTAADVNDAGFGAAIAAQGGASGGTARVDHVRVTVYYTEAAAGAKPGVQTVCRRAEQPTDPIFTE